MKKRKKLGGQAVIEGVLIKSDEKVAIVVRNTKGKLIVKKQKSKKPSKIPIWRGFTYMIDMLVIGFNALMWSAEMASGEEEKLSKKEFVLTVAFSILFGLLLFVVIPFFVTLFITKSNSLMFNIIEGMLRVAIVLTYIITISRMSDVKRVFEYHGAEHKVVNCYEQNKKLTYNNIKKCSSLHPRCGTAFLLIVLAISILIFSLIVTDSLFTRFISRILLIPLIAGLSYELLKLSDKFKHNFLFKIITAPGLFLQRLTTAEPDKKQIEVALKAMNSVL